MKLENEQLEEPQNEELEQIQDEEVEEEVEEPQKEESSPAQDALDEASEAEKLEVDPKDAVIGDFRKQLRESELIVAELKGQIEASKPKEKEPEPEVVKSPMDIALEEAAKEQGVDIDEAEVVMTGKLNREQKAFEVKQREQQTATSTKEQSDAQSSAAFITAGETMNAKAMGEGLDFKTIITAADELVSKADMTWLASKSKDYVDFYDRYYKFAVKQIIEAGGENAEILQAKIKAHSQAKPKEEEPEKKPVPTKKRIIETTKAISVQEAQVNSIMNA